MENPNSFQGRLSPQPIAFLGWVALAGLVGFIGNEAVAIFRIRVGREINSVALIADGYHARTDGLTSLAVVAGAAGVWLGFPLADPIVGLLITFAIFSIVWQSSVAVFTRMLDGVDPNLIATLRHAAERVPAVRRVVDVRARWIGHRLNAELDVAVEGTTSVAEADAIRARLKHELQHHVPYLAGIRACVLAEDKKNRQPGQAHDPHHLHTLAVLAFGTATLFVLDSLTAAVPVAWA